MDPLAELVPLPYRVLLLVNVGVAFWYINILVCQRLHIDLLLVLRLKHPDLSMLKLARGARATLVRVSIAGLANYLVYLLFYTNSLAMPLLNWFPLMGLAFVAFTLYYPGFFANAKGPSVEAVRLAQTLRRILRGGIDPAIRNNDIILTDTLTSYNKTIVDLLVYVSSLLLGYEVLPLSSKDLSSDHLQIYNLDLVLANFPSALRLSQCLCEYCYSGFANKTHFFNAIKYSTAFFPTICLILKRTGSLSSNVPWILFSLLNSSYSFFWDVSNDWNFGFFYRYLAGHSELPLLRARLIYDVRFYLLAVAVDFSLRFLWVFKVLYPSPSDSALGMLMYTLFHTELGAFATQVLEITRRWVWIFVKVETEYIKANALESDVELQSIN